MRPIQPLQRALRGLRKVHQLMCGFNLELCDAVKVRVRHHHHVAGSVWIRIQADEAMLPALHQSACLFRLVDAHPVLDRVIYARNQIAKDAAKIAGPRVQTRRHPGTRSPIRGSHVRKSPRTPELVHIRASQRLLSSRSVEPSIEAESAGPCPRRRSEQTFFAGPRKLTHICIQRHTAGSNFNESSDNLHNSCSTSSSPVHNCQSVGLTEKTHHCYTKKRSFLRGFQQLAAAALQPAVACLVFPKETSRFAASSLASSPVSVKLRTTGFSIAGGNGLRHCPPPRRGRAIRRQNHRRRANESELSCQTSSIPNPRA